MTTIMAMYMGEKPQTRQPKEAFYLGIVPIVKEPIEVGKDFIQLSREPILEDYIILTSGSFYITPGMRIGVLPGTSFAIYGLSDEVADPLLAGVEGWAIKEIDFETFQSILERASKQADQKSVECADHFEMAYARFYRITAEDFDDDCLLRLVVNARPKGEVLIQLSIDLETPAKNFRSVMHSVGYIQHIAELLKLDDLSIVVILARDRNGEKPDDTFIYKYNAEV